MLFDRSWYNRAGVERVMGFCTEADVEEFFRTVPEFERMLVRSGIMLIKYWFSITDEEQNLRFLMRIHDPLKQWKLSPMDLESRRRWEQYTKAKEEMLERTHIPEAPLVGGAGGRQEARAAELHPSPAAAGALRGSGARADRAARARAQAGLYAASGAGGFVRSGSRRAGRRIVWGNRRPGMGLPLCRNTPNRKNAEARLGISTARRIGVAQAEKAARPR